MHQCYIYDFLDDPSKSKSANSRSSFFKCLGMGNSLSSVKARCRVHIVCATKTAIVCRTAGEHQRTRTELLNLPKLHQTRAFYLSIDHHHLNQGLTFLLAEFSTLQISNCETRGCVEIPLDWLLFYHAKRRTLLL